MILHAASIAAFFVAQTPQAQYAVQCVQAAPGTWLDRLLYFLPQFMVSVIPVAGGVGIAWMAFRWNRKKERAQWVRDQKIAEWRKLLECISEFDSLFPGYVSDLEGFYHNDLALRMRIP